MKYKIEIEDLITGLSRLLGGPISSDNYEIIVLNAGENHELSQLPEGKMAVYMFLYKDRFLKIGRAGKIVSRDIRLNITIQIEQIPLSPNPFSMTLTCPHTIYLKKS